MFLEAAVVAETRPRVSVALCVHDGAAFLREQVDSILAQSEARFELVALDDASTDDSLAILREYAARDARVRVESNAVNLGAARSFERAMALARAPFIAPCDQDDVWHPRKLERLLAAIGDRDLAYADSIYVDARGNDLGRRVSDDVDMMDGRGALRFAFSNTVSGHAALLRRELFEAARPFPHELHHDWWLAANAAARRGIVYLDEPLVWFRRHGAALTTLGRGGCATVERTTQWLAQSRRLLVAMCGRAGEDRHAAARLLAALELVLAGGSEWPLLAEIWHHRRRLVPDRHVLGHAIRLQLRMRRRLHRVTPREREALMQQLPLR